MRKMASIQKVVEIQPIEGADKIERITVQGWHLVAKKGEFKVGDLCVYIEIDALLPKDIEAFAFMEKYKFRVKTIKLRGQISQGLALPFSAFSSNPLLAPIAFCKEGDDVSEQLGVTKYDPEAVEEEKLIASMSGKKEWWAKYMKFWLFRKLVYPFVKPENDDFPTHLVSKTDETRIQNCSKVLEEFKDVVFVETEKLEGQSATYIFEEKGFGKFYVCSRNKRLLRPNSSNYWKIATQCSIKNVLKSLSGAYGGTWVIQGEIIGEGIQGNIYGIKGLDFYAYNLKRIDKDGSEKLFNPIAGEYILEDFYLKWVPILGRTTLNGKTVDEIVLSADGKSVLADVSREGKVYRSLDDNKPCSFKAVSNAYLIEHGK